MWYLNHVVNKIVIVCVCFLLMVSQPGRKLPRFPAPSDCLSDVEPDTRELVRAQNKKKKKSGGFQSMGESEECPDRAACPLLADRHVYISV